MTTRYILENKKAIPCPDLMAWAEWYEKADRHVAKTTMGDVFVSTVFLGLDHAPDRREPELFETMVFGGKHDQDQWRTPTWEKAEAKHNEVCEMILGEQNDETEAS